MRWVATETGLLFTKRQAYAESVPSFWEEITLNLPSCILSETSDYGCSCSLIECTLSRSTMRQIKRLKVDRVRKSEGHMPLHLFTEASTFSNIKALTVRHNLDLICQQMPTTYAGTLTRVGRCKASGPTEFGVHHSVAVYFEVFMFVTEGGMIVVTNADCKTILQRLDTTGHETGYIVVTRSRSDDELRQWETAKETLKPRKRGMRSSGSAKTQASIAQSGT